MNLSSAPSLTTPHNPFLPSARVLVHIFFYSFISFCLLGGKKNPFSYLYAAAPSFQCWRSVFIQTRVFIILAEFSGLLVVSPCNIFPSRLSAVSICQSAKTLPSAFPWMPYLLSFSGSSTPTVIPNQFPIYER